MRLVRHLIYILLVLSRMAVWAVAEPEELQAPHAAGHEHPADEEHHHGDGDDRHESPDSPCHHHDEHCPCAPPSDGLGVTPSPGLVVSVADGVPSSYPPDASPRLRIPSCDIFHPPRA